MEESTINYLELYDKEYYSNYGKSGQHYLLDNNIRMTMYGFASFISNALPFRSHLDVGCAFGLLVDLLRKKGYESFGLDVSEYAIQNALPGARRFVWTQNIATEPIVGKYDLVTCLEVIEHIHPDCEENVLDAITQVTKHVYFSSEYNLDEPTHVNCKPLSYWIFQFSERGFTVSNKRYYGIPWGRLFNRRSKPTNRELYESLDKETRYEVYARDNFRCVACNSKGVQIHEIVPRSFFGRNTMWQCFSTKNRVCLCPSCHNEAHTHPQRVKLLKLMSEKYKYLYTEDFYQQYTGD